MAAHSSALAWRIPWTKKPGRLQSMGSHRVRHDWSDLAAAAAYIKQKGNKDLLCSSGNYIWYLIIIYGKRVWKRDRYTDIDNNHFAVHLKPCKSTTFRFKKRKKTRYRIKQAPQTYSWGICVFSLVEFKHFYSFIFMIIFKMLKKVYSDHLFTKSFKVQHSHLHSWPSGFQAVHLLRQLL